MNVVVEILDSFPTSGVLAIARVILDSSLVINGVRLMIDGETHRYYIKYPVTSEHHKPLIKLRDEELSHKLFDAMVFQYEKYIDLQCDSNERCSDAIKSMLSIEKARIEAKRRRERKKQ